MRGTKGTLEVRNRRDLTKKKKTTRNKWERNNGRGEASLR